METKIRVLDEQTINQIAAGEVIENPASVVKEIIENAIDAEATEIHIEILQGGRSLIRIADNGCGMTKDDAILSIERHATSKIRNVDEIQKITSMGFRGEAIASIASISKFSILTAAKNQEKATLVLIEGGKILHVKEAFRSQGTTIEVKSLFFNVPVRRNFQKSPTYDTNEILKVVSLMALAHPEISFKLISNEKKILSTENNLDERDKKNLKKTLKSRITSILGEDYSESLIPVEKNLNGYHLFGFIGLPEVTRQNKTGQYLFINKRAIQNTLVSYAVREGYFTSLSPNRYPLYVLHLTCPTEFVDVNVHPQKREVRLRQEQFLKEFITNSVAGTLQTTPFDSFSNVESEVKLMPEKVKITEEYYSPAVTLSTKSLLANRYQEIIEENKSEESAFTRSFARENFTFKNFSTFKKENPSTNFYHENTYEPKESEEKIETSYKLEHLFGEKEHKTLEVIGTIPSYILIDSRNSKTETVENELLIGFVDEKRARARILFEKLLQGHEVEREVFLIPLSLEVSTFEETLIIQKLDFLNEMGIKIYQSGPKTFLIDSLPSFLDKDLGKEELAELILELSDEFKNNLPHNMIEKEREKHFANFATRSTFACKRELSLEEAKSLIDQLMKCRSPYYCPKGNRTIAYLSKEKIKNLF